MRLRLLLPLLCLFLLPLGAMAQPAPVEARWTRVLPGDIEKYELNFSNLRVNNIEISRDPGQDPNGPATAHDFSASVANRNADWRRVIVQLVGVRQDGTPVFSTEGQADVDGRRNEGIRVRVLMPDGDLRQVAVFYIRALALPPG